MRNKNQTGGNESDAIKGQMSLFEWASEDCPKEFDLSKYMNPPVYEEEGKEHEA